MIYPWSLPGATFHLGVDSLSAAFLFLVLVVGFCAGIYGEGYLSASSGHIAKAPARFFFATLIISMAFLVCARNAVLFLVCWEIMALSAFGLVSLEHQKEEVRKAGKLYLLCTHTGSLCLLTGFAFLWKNAGSFEFGALLAAKPLSMLERTSVFWFFLIGFGMKAGFWPLHIWLQEAHPAAPSHASAAMSGVMIEMGLYGLLRFFSILGPVSISASVFLMVLGLFTALFGIVFASMQRDFKRLLAYSSIENIGIILAASGLGCYGISRGDPALSLLGFSAAILHTLNHGFFKSLMFLSAGSVYLATGTRDIESCGGLQKIMPRVAALTAVGSLAICGLPPLNGFTGEWLLYCGFLRMDYRREIIFFSLAAAALSLIGGLAILTFSKFYGLVFLGKPRSLSAQKAKDPSSLMLIPMGILAALCLSIGLFPGWALKAAFFAAADISRPAPLVFSAGLQKWSTLLDAVGLMGAMVCLLSAVFWTIKKTSLKKRPASSGATWGCGFSDPTPRMQYTGSSYSMPATRTFHAFLMQKESHSPNGYWPQSSSFHSRVPDPALDVWLPKLLNLFEGLISWPKKIQRGKLQFYLLYAAAFLIAILLWKL
jgi:formate hydrogenlyase subunit 3/multisubunit Na+/H+ antiporter MnhD subunit